MKNKLSEFVLKLALTIFRDPKIAPTSEAALAALLFVHVAWNRSLGENDAHINYKSILQNFENLNPSLRNEFKEKKDLKIINFLIAEKNKYFPNDKRIIKVCGMRDGNVHVEWVDG